jgi:DNA polymerase-1
MIMQVHDELVFEIKECDLKSIGPKICDLMIHAEMLNVPLIVNTFNGNNWSEG